MSSKSVGGLHLEVKLDTRGAEKQLKALGRVIKPDTSLLKSLSKASGQVAVEQARRDKQLAIDKARLEGRLAADKAKAAQSRANEAAKSASRISEQQARTKAQIDLDLAKKKNGIDAALAREKARRETSLAVQAQRKKDQQAAYDRRRQDQLADRAKAAADRQVAAQKRAAVQAAKAAERAAEKQKRLVEKAAKDAERAAEKQKRLAEKAARDADRVVKARQRAVERAAAAERREANRVAAGQRRLAADVRRAANDQRRAANDERRAAQSAQRARATASRASQMRRSALTQGSFGAGAALFSGLGAARSGNPYYAAAAGMRGMASAASLLSVTMRGLANPVALVAAAVLGGVAVYAAAAASLGFLATAVVKAGTALAITLEKQAATFTGLLGSVRAGEKELKFLTELGKTSLVPTESLIDADQQLLGFGVTAKNTRRELVKFISDWGTATQRSQEQLYFFSLAVGQVVSKGKADAIDLRQLANAGLPQEDLFAGMAQASGRSIDELKKGVSEGLISADLLTEGIKFAGAKYAAGAKVAQNTLAGLWSNFKDQLKIGLGETFRQAGVTDGLKRIVKDAGNFMRSNPDMFVPLALSAKRFFATVAAGFGAVFNGGGDRLMVTLFEKMLPIVVDKATTGVAYMFGFFKQTLPAIVETIKKAWGVMYDFFAALGRLAAAIGPAVGLALSNVTTALVGFGSATISTIKVLKMLNPIALGVKFVKEGPDAVLDGLKEDFEGVKQSLSKGWDATKDTAAAWGQAAAALRDLSSVAAGFEKIKFDKINTPDVKIDGIKKIGKAVGDALAGSVEQSSEEALQAAQSGAQELFDMLRRWFGRPSDALEGLFGDDTRKRVEKRFTATADSIASTAKSIYENLEKIAPAGREALLGMVDGTARELLRLQRRFEKLKKQWEKYRDFVKDSAGTIRDFLRDLNTEESERKYITYTSSGVLVEEKEAAGSWVAALKNRLVQFRKFARQVAQLRKQGISKGLLKSLVSEGPEAAGDAVNELAEGGRKVVREASKLYEETGKVAKQFSEKNAKIIFGEGKRQGGALADGLYAQMERVGKRAEALAKKMLSAIRPFAVDMKNAGIAAGNAYADGVGFAVTNRAPKRKLDKLPAGKPTKPFRIKGDGSPRRNGGDFRRVPAAANPPAVAKPPAGRAPKPKLTADDVRRLWDLGVQNKSDREMLRRMMRRIRKLRRQGFTGQLSPEQIAGKFAVNGNEFVLPPSNGGRVSLSSVGGLEPAPVAVSVFIGERELTDITRSEVKRVGREDRVRNLAGGGRR